MKSKGNNSIQMTTAKILYNNLHSTGVTVSNSMSLLSPIGKKTKYYLSKKKKKRSPDNWFAVWTLKKHELLSYTTIKCTNLDEKGSIPKVFSEEFNICLQQMFSCVVKRQGQGFWWVNIPQRGIFAELQVGETWGTSALEAETPKVKTHNHSAPHQPWYYHKPTGQTIHKSFLLKIGTEDHINTS